MDRLENEKARSTLGNETEQVDTLTFLSNGERISAGKPQVYVEAQTFRMHRVSRIRGIRQERTVEVHDSRIEETIRVSCEKAVPVNHAIVAMYPWTDSTTKCTAGRESKTLHRISFDADKKMHELSNALWMGIYDPSSSKGAVTIVAKAPKPERMRLRVWNVPGTYHKLYNWTWMNNGYHAEHHYRPKMHWTKMPALHREIAEEQARQGVRVIKPPHPLGFLDPDLPRG